MAKKATHIRKKPALDSDLYCGGGRCNDQTALQSVGPKQAAQADCRRCKRAKKAGA